MSLIVILILGALGVGVVRRASLDFKLSLILCALISIACALGLKSYRDAVDWTSRGLNPNHPGFNPTVVLLAGTFDYCFTGSDTRKHYEGTARFEIRMRGSDYYYAERWTGHSWKYGSWDALTLLVGNSCFTWDRAYSGSGHHATGGGSGTSDDVLLVARRLWRGREFIGARADQISICGATERFSDVKRFGRFQIPTRIEWTDHSRREVLRVRRVEFLNEPTANWFLMIKSKYFDRRDESQKLLEIKLNEAGWSGQDRP